MSINGGGPRVKYLYLHFKVCGVFSPPPKPGDGVQTNGVEIRSVSLIHSLFKGIFSFELGLRLASTLMIHGASVEPQSPCSRSLLNVSTSSNLSKVSPPKRLMRQNVTTETVSWHEQWERRLLQGQRKQKRRGKKKTFQKAVLEIPGVVSWPRPSP